MNKVEGKTFLTLKQDTMFNLVSDVKHPAKKSYLFVSNRYRILEKEKKTLRKLYITVITEISIICLIFLLTNTDFFPLFILILGEIIVIVVLQKSNINSFYIEMPLSILVILYCLSAIFIYIFKVESIYKSKDTIKSIKYQFDKFSYQIRNQDSIENLLNSMTFGCHVVKFPYLVGEDRTEPQIIFFIYQNCWDILKLPMLYFKCKLKKH